MNQVQIWNEAGFRSSIQNGGLVLVDFFSEWCGPCKLQAKTLEAMISDIPETVSVGKVDVSEAPSVAAEYRIVSIPTLLLFRDGAVLESHVGLCGRDELLAMLKKHL